MRRDKFMKELEYLLQDIPDEDKADAIAYYQDYLEEAGPENEEKVIQDFGSPERVAAIIRADIYGTLEDGGEFTEKGYEDERFKEPNLGLVKSGEGQKSQSEQQVKEERKGNAYAAGNDRQGAYGAGNNRQGAYGAGDNRQGAYGAGNNGQGAYGAGNNGQRAYGAGGYGSGIFTENTPPGHERKRWEWWQILGMIILGCCVVPVVIPLVFGIGGGAVGLLVGLIGLLAGVLVALSIGLAAVTFALLLAGVILVIVSFGQISINLIHGILCLGTGVGILGLGMLFLALCGLYYGMFLPWLVKSMINGISRLIHRKEVSV